MLCISVAAKAKCLVLTLSSGSKVYYQLGDSNNPIMHFTDDRVSIDTRTFTFQSISSFFISEEAAPDGIAEVVEKRDATFRNNTLVVRGCKAAEVRVIDASGRTVRAEVMQEGDCVTVNLSQLPSSTYIIRVGKDTFKVNKHS